MQRQQIHRRVRRTRRPAVTNVDLATPRLRGRRPRAHAAARPAPHQPRQQRRLSRRPRPTDRHLRRLPPRSRHQRRVRRPVHRLTRPQLPQVHPVRQQLPDTARRHVGLACQPRQILPRRPPLKQRPHQVSPVGRHQPPGRRVLDVPKRHLPLLPHPPLNRPEPQRSEPLRMPLKLSLRDRRMNRPGHPPIRRRRINVLRDRNNPPAGRLNTLIDLKGVLRRPRHPRQVRHDQTCITTLLDVVKRTIQNRALSVRTLRVQLRRQHLHVDLVRRSPPANRGGLLVRTVKPVALSPSHKGNSDIPDVRRGPRTHPRIVH